MVLWIVKFGSSISSLQKFSRGSSSGAGFHPALLLKPSPPPLRPIQLNSIVAVQICLEIRPPARPVRSGGSSHQRFLGAGGAKDRNLETGLGFEPGPRSGFEHGPGSGFDSTTDRGLPIPASPDSDLS